MEEKKALGRPKKEGALRTKPLNLRVTESTKSELLGICEVKAGASETQVISELIHKEAKRLKITVPTVPRH